MKLSIKRRRKMDSQEIIYRGFRPDKMAGPARVYRIIIEDGEELREVLSPERSQKLWNHSPDGFQWSYSGSGPAQLALALLLDAGMDNHKAVRLHQAFKMKFVAQWGEQWQMSRDEILEWAADFKG